MLGGGGDDERRWMVGGGDKMNTLFYAQVLQFDVHL